MAPIRVLLADDHLLFRKGLQALLGSRADVQVVGEAADGAEAVAKARALGPDVVLMDIHMPGTNGLQATSLVKESMPQVKVLILTVSDEEEHLFEAIKVGAEGYLLKNVQPEELFEMLHGVMRGETPLSPAVATKVLNEFRRRTPQPTSTSSATRLTPREREILSQVAHGASNKEIASRLVVTEGTVKNHLHNILEKLHLQNRVQATAFAIQEGLTTVAQGRRE